MCIALIFVSLVVMSVKILFKCLNVFLYHSCRTFGLPLFCRNVEIYFLPLSINLEFLSNELEHESNNDKNHFASRGMVGNYVNSDSIPKYDPTLSLTKSKSSDHFP